jgi:peptidoglycan/xylan/chitin deacetylase (PgdA/CDA1 family)
VTALRPLALTYHGVGRLPLREDPMALLVTPDRLRRQIRLLRRRGYTLVTFGELVRNVTDGQGAGRAALTFDDGFADNLHVLAPILEEMSAPATVFIISGWVGKWRPRPPALPVLTADEVRRLHAAGVEIGGHTVTHPDLTTLPYEQARRELADARAALEELIDAPVTSAAYPFGRATDETVRACAAAGFEAAGRTSGEGSFERPLDFPREDMNSDSTLMGLRLKIAGRYEPLMRHRSVRAVRRLERLAQAVGHR